MIAAGTVFTAQTIIALAGITATGLVGVGVAAFSSRAESKRLGEQFAFQRWETDRQELRAMLDALAADLAALPEAFIGLDRMVRLEKTISSTPPDALTSWVARELFRLSDMQERASRSLERVRLRLDDDATDCLAIARALIERSRQPTQPWTHSSPADLLAASRETAEQYRNFIGEARKITASAKVYRST